MVTLKVIWLRSFSEKSSRSKNAIMHWWNDSPELDEILDRGAEKANIEANKMVPKNV